MKIEELRDVTTDVDFRFKRAQQLIKDDELPDPKIDDKRTWQAYRFITEVHGCDTPGDLIALKMDYPNEMAAFDIRNATDDRRYLLEAMSLCSDLELEDQAKELGVSPEVVVTYEDFFYDVRKYRDNNPGFLLMHVLKPAMMNTLKDGNDPDFVWKFVAASGGFEVLEACYSYSVRNPEKVQEFHREAGVTHLYRNFGLSQYSRPINKFTANEITEPMLRMVELQIKETAVVGANHVKERAEVLRSMIKTAQFTVLDPDEEFESGHEPRFKDLLAANMAPATVGEE